MKYSKYLFLLLIFTSLSCQPTSVPPPHNKQMSSIKIGIDDQIEGQFLAVFETVNPQITSRVTGAFTFSVEKQTNEVVSDVRISNAGPDLIHAQNVRTGKRCPDINDDLNADGIIDAFEGEQVYGDIIIPLDGDLSSQSSHDGEFPKGDTYGDYIYARVADFSRFMKDLRNNIQSDGYTKLQDLEPLNIENRVVVIHGVDEAVDLPRTVRSVRRNSEHQELPIVCGVIKKIITTPGQIEE